MDEHWMRLALEQAHLAERAGEVPIGAVLVFEGRLIAASFNQVIARSDPSAHAEINVLRLAGQQFHNYRLTGCELYVNLEPCPMCEGALVHARIKRCVFGAFDNHSQIIGLQGQGPKANHTTLRLGGVLEADSRRLIQNFFKSRRRQKISTKPLDRSVDKSI